MRLEEERHKKRQRIVADRLAGAWKCEWSGTPAYARVDIYLLRNKQIAAIAEIKSREREFAAFPTIHINLDKWFPLMQSEMCLGIAALFVIAFTDGIYYVRIGDLPVNEFKISYRGRTDRPHAVNDARPVIEVPTRHFRRIADAAGVFEDELAAAS